MLKDKYIILYSDDFDIDIWARYMDIFELPYTEEKIKIGIKNIALWKEVYNDNNLENTEEYIEEWVAIQDKTT